jgi:hypothetical protein
MLRLLFVFTAVVLLSACGGAESSCAERPGCSNSRSFNERECLDDLRVLRTSASGRCDRQMSNSETCLISLTCSDSPAETCGSSRSALGACLGGSS